jgi:hypothetical protein
MIPHFFLYFSVPMLRAFFIGVIMLANSCNQTDTEQVRKPNTSWQSSDQPPVYPGCEDRESTADQWDCFQASISRAVGVFFTDNPFPLNPNAPKAVILHVIVDQRGKVQLKGMKPETDYKTREVMQIAIEKLPTVSPATKTNLGVTTQVQFRIPIQLQN